MPSIAELDKNMQGNFTYEEEKIRFVTLQEPGIRVSGLLGFEENGRLDRIPEKYHKILEAANSNLVVLGENTAGGQISFRSNTGSLWIRAELKAVPELSHMTAIGQGGFDCYVGRNREEMLFLGSTLFDFTKTEYECEILPNKIMEDFRAGRPAEVPGEEPPFYEFLINLPLYCSVKRLEIGIEREASIEPPAPYAEEGSLVIYGTSITQGACASRPGICYTGILARKLNMKTYNFGFSGNGLGEPQMADLLAEIPDPRAYVIDYEANAGAWKLLKSTLEPFIRRLKEVHPETPVAVVSKFPFVFEMLDPKKREEWEDLRSFQRDTAKKLDEELGEVWFIDGKKLFPEDCWEMTIDTIHPTDVGFDCMARVLLPELRKILRLS